jgi:F-box associated protein
MQPINLLSLPEEIKCNIFSLLSLNDLVKLRKTAKICGNYLDTYSDYWEKQYLQRLGPMNIILGRIKEMNIYDALLHENPPKPLKILCKIHENYSKFLGNPRFCSRIKYKGHVNSLIAFETPNTRKRDLYFFDEENKLRRIPPKDYLNKEQIESPQEIIQMPIGSVPSCLASSAHGLFIGTHEGMIYFLDLAKDSTELIPIMKNKAAHRIYSIDIAEASNENIVLLAIIQGDPVNETFIYTFSLSDPQNGTSIDSSTKAILYSFPRLISPTYMLCPFSEGGFYITDLETGEKKNIELFDQSTHPLKPMITAICSLTDRIIIGTSNGQIGWIHRADLELKAAKITWCNFFNQNELARQIKTIMPIGPNGFYVHVWGGKKYPVLSSATGEYKQGKSLRKFFKNPIWLENGMLFFKNNNTGIHCMDYTNSIVKEVKKEGLAKFWKNANFG